MTQSTTLNVASKPSETASKTALVIDDEADLCRLMQITLKKMGIHTDIAYDLATARTHLTNNDYDFCLTDLRLPDGSGLELVKEIGQKEQAMPIAVITAHGSMDLAIEALKYGAFDFVNKPLELPRLRQLVEHALKVLDEKAIDTSDEETAKKAPAELMRDERLIGNSPAMRKLKATIIKLARSQAPVFLWGESGTGKEVVAKLIHDLSSRREGSFVPVNCGAIPSELMESEFFGHKKGSFTGATTDKIGLFQQADGGTLFLDEVADLPLAMQVKLLRAIQEKTVRAIGDTKEVAVDIRILSATHKDLAKLVQQGAFRQDLFYRINVIELKLPTLNERGDDIEHLATHFLNEIVSEWQLADPITLSPDAITALSQHRFEGNVRELRNLLERAITLTESSTITAEHLGLSSDLRSGLDAENSQLSTNTGTNLLSENQSNAANQSNDTTSSAISSSFGSNHYPTAHASSSLIANITDIPSIVHRPQGELNDLEQTNIPDEGLEAFLQEKERQVIICALNQTNWNKTNAAKLLQTSFRSLRYRMKKLGIENDGDEEDDTE